MFNCSYLCAKYIRNRFVLTQFSLSGSQLDVRRDSGRLRQRLLQDETKRSHFHHFCENPNRGAWCDVVGHPFSGRENGRRSVRECLQFYVFYSLYCQEAR